MLRICNVDDARVERSMSGAIRQARGYIWKDNDLSQSHNVHAASQDKSNVHCYKLEALVQGLRD